MPPAVKSPDVGLIEPPPATTDQLGTIGITLPLASLPTAVNCWVVLMTSETGFGVTVIVASGPATTMTVAVPDIPSLVALTVLLYVPGTVPAVKRPDAPIVPPPAAMDHAGVTATAAPAKSEPVAVNCCVAPTASVTGFGVTTSLVRLPGPLIPCTSHEAVMAPAIATAAMTRAMRACAASARAMRLFMTLLIELLLT